MAGFLLAVLLALTALVSPAYAEEATRDLRITDVMGQVTLEPVEKPKPVPVDEDTPLKAGDVVATGKDGRAELTLDGGTVFRMQPGSRLKVVKIFVRNTQLEVLKGGFVAKVQKIINPTDGMIIKLPTAVVAVRGTEFGVETRDMVSHVGVFDEGKVAVGGAWGHEHVLLGPNQETHVPLSNVPQPPRALSHFKLRREQMALVRGRALYWHQHWAPMGSDQRRHARARLRMTKRTPTKGFIHSAVKRAAPKPVRAVRKKSKRRRR